MPRKPIVAGMFYPEGKKELDGMLDKLLLECKSENIGNDMHGLVVPHAGYVYSGRVAAEVYNLIRGRNIKKLILIGPSHHAQLNGSAMDVADYWETPLGKVKLCKEKLKCCKVDGMPHKNEHSLEVQIPFLQKVLGIGFEIIPIVCGMLQSRK